MPYRLLTITFLVQLTVSSFALWFVMKLTKEEGPFRPQCTQAEQAWGHDAFFDYVDRWMYEDDSAFVKTIKEATGRDHDKEWARQSQAWDAFVNEMWAEHRPVLQAPTDGWKQNHDDAYYRMAIAE